MAMIGYARVSTIDQNLDSQLTALKRAGCQVIYREKRSGGKRDRAELDKALKRVQPGDIFVVYKLSRAARSLRHLLGIVDDLRNRGVTFMSLTESIDTSTMTGRLLLGIIGVIDEFLRELIVENTLAGLAEARVKGHVPGARTYGFSKSTVTDGYGIATIDDEVSVLVQIAGWFLDDRESQSAIVGK